MLRVALIRDGFVENVIQVDTAYHPATGVEAIALADNSPISVGWARVDDQFIPPPAPDPDPDWGAFRVGIGTSASYMAIAIQMNAASPIAFQQMQIAIAEASPYLPFVTAIWNGFVSAGVQIPAESIAEWNAIAVAAHVPLRYGEGGLLVDITQN